MFKERTEILGRENLAPGDWVEMMFETDVQYIRFFDWAAKHKYLGWYFASSGVFTAVRVTNLMLQSAPLGLLDGLRPITQEDIDEENQIADCVGDANYFSYLLERIQAAQDELTCY